MSSFKMYLTDPRFDCLAFSDVTVVDDDRRRAVRESIICALKELFSRLDISNCSSQPNCDLRQELWWWGATTLHPLCNNEDRLRALLTECATAVEQWYPLACTETQVWYAKGLAIGGCADDSVCIAPGGLAKFASQMWTGNRDQTSSSSSSTSSPSSSPPPSRLSEVFAEFVQGFMNYFAAADARVGLLGASSWVDFGLACSLERDVESGNLPHLHGTPSQGKKSYLDGLPKTMRRLSGLGASMMTALFTPTVATAVPLPYWIPILEYADTYVGLLNDLVSLPKEILAGETFNYFSLQTRARSAAGVPSAFGDELWTFRDTVCETMDKVYEATCAMDQALIQFAE